MLTANENVGNIRFLKIRNFKSYRGFMSIGPFLNFNAIVGINGAGKSNIMDAISFVLGLRTEQLRGKLKELLYEGGKDDSTGYVKLIFQSEFEGDVEFCRAIVPHGSESVFTSEYSIDGNVVPLDVYTAKLESFGILVKARNFLVFQGDIESVAAITPKELTRMFEHVSGSVQFVKEYERLAMEKENSESEMLHLLGKKKILESEARQNKDLMIKEKKHRKVEIELEKEQKKLCAWKMYVLEEAICQTMEKKREVDQKLQSALRSRTVCEGHVRTKREEKVELERAILEGESKLRSLKNALDGIETEGIRISEEKKRLEKQRRSSLKKQSEYEQRLSTHSSHVRKLQNDLEAMQSALRRFEEIVATEGSQGMNASEEDLDAYRQIKNQIVVKAGRLHQEKTALDLAQSTLLEALDRVRTRNERLKSQMDDRGRVIDEMDAKQRNDFQEQKEIEEKMIEIQLQIQQRVQKTQQDTAKRDQTILSIEKINGEIAEAKEVRRESRRDAAIVEAIEKLKRKLPGVYGRVTALGKVRQSKYQLAMAVALGSNLESVLVDTRETGIASIQFLKENKYPPLTFLPLDFLQTKPINENLRRLGGSAKLAIDLLDFESKYEKGFRFVCGNAVICDDASEAKHLAFDRKIGVKVVATNGTMIQKSGFVTGGLSENVESRASKWDDERFILLHRKKNELETELRRLPSVRERQLEDMRLASELNLLQKRKALFVSENESHRLEKERKQNEIAKFQKEYEKLEPEIEALERQVDSRSASIKQLQVQIDQIADREFREFCEKRGVENYRKYEERYLERPKQIRKQRLEFETQIGHLNMQLEYERSRDFRKPLDDLMTKMENESTLLRQLETEGVTQEAKRAQTTGEMETIKTKVEEWKQTLSMRMIEMREGNAADKKLKEEILKLQSQYEGLEVQSRLLSEQRSDALLTATLEIGQDVVPDFDVLPEEWKNSETLRNETFRLQIDTELRSKILELKNYLSRSSPNLKASEQYKQIKDQEIAQFEILKEARKKEKEIQQAFAQINQQRTSTFMEAFEHIASQIDAIYKELTRSEQHPYGGSAALYLESEETPFLGGIKLTAIPPSKRYREMEQLSGGEKTIIALALLFAVHSFRPCPFFVLDEIDASLDSVNVDRVADYLRRKTHEEGRGRFQAIVISLKDTFYHKADCLLGITRNVQNKCSEMYSYNLEAFERRRQIRSLPL